MSDEKDMARYDFRLGVDNAADDIRDRGRTYALERFRGLSPDHEGGNFVDGYAATLNKAYTEAVARMSVQAVDTKPVDIDWQEAAGEDYDGWTFWQEFTYELDDGREVTLIARGPGAYVAALMTDAGTLYDRNEWDTYREYNEDDTGELRPGAFTEREFEDLFDVEPYYHGTEGPMMNYWYPLDESVHIYGGGFDPMAAAAKLRHTALCVVEVDGNYGLALTGGGMDLSWDICEAFVALDMLPPTHFADLPRFAGTEATDTRLLVLAGMERALTWQQNNLGYRLERLRQLRQDIQKGAL